ALAALRLLFEPPAIIGKALDQATYEIVRPGMRDIAHGGGHIDHRIALDHAELVIVEIAELHRCLLDPLVYRPGFVSGRNPDGRQNSPTRARKLGRVDA